MERVLQRLEELYAIGGGPGANRIGYSPEEDEAHRIARGWMEQAGLEVSSDEAGNLIGRHPAGGQVWTGSHLDSVPAGGKYDGALGVVAGIEAVERAGAGTVVAFRDEERGCAGSRGFTESPAAFFELHIEQGPVLEERGAPLGVVTGIVGYARRRVAFDGRAGHAGTTPMGARDDALCAASAYVLRVRDVARAIDGAVATVGDLHVEPGAANVVPGRVTLSVDARAPDLERLDRLLTTLGLELDPRTPPAGMDPELRSVLRAELDARGLPVVELTSGAGHDAGILASRGVPAVMLFVRSLNDGVSHSPDELSSADDIALGAEILAAALSSR